MLRSYIITALRNLRRYKWYSALKTIGFALGLSCSALIIFYISFELSYDSHNSKADRIYRVYKKEPGNIFLGSDLFAVVQAPLGKAMESDFPEIESSVKLKSNGETLISKGSNSFYEEGVYFAESSLFEIFDFEFSRGKSSTALTEPFSAVLSEEIAKKYFGSENPIGKIIRLRNEYDLKITGVMKDIPLNSHFIPKMLISFSTYEATTSNKNNYNWANSSFFTYVLLKNNVNINSVEQKLPSFVEKYLGKLFKEWGQEDPTQFILQPLKDVHMNSSQINFDIGESNDIKNIYILIALALVILVTGSINYMNLSTARASLRAKEVGIRKTAGANRFEIIKQFLGESLTITFISACMAVILIIVALPKFSELVQRNFSLQLLFAPKFILGFFLITVLIGIIAGSYPAFVLSLYKPVNVLKGTNRISLRSKFRDLLVIVQFSTAIALIVSSVVILKQLNYIRTGNMGYNRNNILVLNLRGSAIQQKAEVLKENLLRNPEIISVVGSSHLPVDIGSQTKIEGFGEEGNKIAIHSYQLYVDPSFFDVYKIQLMKGRNFTSGFSEGEKNSYIVNEEFVKKFGWNDPIGKIFMRGPEEARIIGVVKNFHMHSLHQQIAPLFIRLGEPDWVPYLSIKIRPGSIASTKSYIERTWANVINESPIDYSFLDESFNKLYEREERLGEIVTYFTFLAITIASLGLLGLAAFITEQRKKEIGIRKVLGAKTSEVTLQLSKEFMVLVVIANIIAFPLAYYFMSSWLEDFAYRIEISWWIFVLSGLIALLIALATVSYQAIKAALANPVEALRYE